MIDAHTHLDGFDDPDEVVAAALDAGVTGMVAIGCGAESIRKTLDIAGRHRSSMRVVAGVHPQAAARFDVDDFDEVVALCADPLVVGVGETGFDYFRDYGPIEAQDPVFELQAALARTTGKPLVIHTRAAEAHTLEMLHRHAEGVTVVLHCFSLTAHLNEVLERGYYCSFAGNVTYPSAGDLRVAASRIPDDRLLIETDAPYLTPVPHRGSINRPDMLVHTAAHIAQVRGIEVDELESLVDANATAAFGLPASMSSARVRG